MLRIKRLMCLILSLILISLLISCETTRQTTLETVNIILKTDFAKCYVGEEYDAINLIVRDTDINYTAEAYYYKDNKKEYVTVNGTKFTGLYEGKIFIKITAERNDVKKTSNEIELSVLSRKEPEQPEQNNEQSDLVENSLIYSVKTDKYGVKSEIILQDEIKISSESALKTTIPSRSGYNTGYGDNYDVWSWLCFPFSEIYNVNSVDLSNKYMTYCVKFSNAYLWNSFILEDENGTYSSEYSISIGDKVNGSAFYTEALANGWYRVYINFSAVTGDTFAQRIYTTGTNFDITKSKKIMLTTSNSGKNTLNEANIFFDEVYLEDDILDSNAVFKKAEIYPTNLNQETDIDILFIGNSFIYSSDVGNTLQSIADENDKNLYVESYSLGGGIVSEIYKKGIAQYNNSRTNSWGNKLFTGAYDILYIQAVFYNSSDGVQSFLNFFQNNNIKTKIILLTADNEYIDIAESLLNQYYQLGLMSWCRLIYHLKQNCGLTQWDLNQAADDWHANALSGYSAAVMIYYSFYSEMPANLDITHQKLMAGYYISGSSINPYTFAMRGTEQEKLTRFEIIRTAAEYIVENNNYFYILD